MKSTPEIYDLESPSIPAPAETLEHLIEVLQQEVSTEEKQVEVARRALDLKRGKLRALQQAHGILRDGLHAPTTALYTKIHLRDRIVDIMAGHGRDISSKEIQRALVLQGVQPSTNTFYVTLKRLLDSGRIVKQERGLYALNE